MNTIYKWINDNYWYIMALVAIAAMFLWTYGCESKVASLIDPTKQINRAELKVEADYLAGKIQIATEDLDKQDAIKQELLNAVNMVGNGGQINPAGLVNVGATILAIGWGLKKNQALKAATTKNPTNSA